MLNLVFSSVVYLSFKKISLLLFFLEDEIQFFLKGFETFIETVAEATPNNILKEKPKRQQENYNLKTESECEELK